MHKDVYVPNHLRPHESFLQGRDGANQYPGPAIIQRLHHLHLNTAVGDNMAEHQAKLAADSRSFPVFIYDPRKGSRFKERLSLVGNRT